MFQILSFCSRLSSTAQLSQSFNTLCRSGIYLEFSKCSPQLITVRYRKTPCRKPFWLPVAKTKLFQIREKKILPEEEADQLRDLRSHYDAEMNSIKAYFAAENEKLELTQKRTAMEDNFSQLLVANEEENERVRMIRESVLAAELEEEKTDLLEKDRLEKEWFAAKRAEVDSIVKYEKEQSIHFVNLENLDQAVSEAIDNPVSYSFAIETNGNTLWEDAPRGFEASAYWTDDRPRQRLDKPPSQPIPVKFKRTFYEHKMPRRWF